MLMMESLTNWAKENFGLICLLVGLAGVVVSTISVVYEWNERKKRKKG